ncbi:MAG: hypothetical protein EZS28_015762, partial [Streblomastix strix]
MSFQNQKIFELPGAPPDTISSISWSPSSAYLCTAGWDGEIRVWDISTGLNNPGVTITRDKPVFDSSFVDPTTIVTVGADAIVRTTNLTNKVDNVIGQHQLPIRNVVYNPTISSIVTSGWDKMINFWDGKTANKPVLSITSSERVYAMDCIDNQVAFGS